MPLCFDNPESSYRDISTYSLTRGIAVLSLCKIKTLVQNADQLYSLSRRLLGPIPVMVMRHSFFAHFCAGDDQEVRSILALFQRSWILQTVCCLKVVVHAHQPKSQYACTTMLMISVEILFCLCRAFSQQFESFTSMALGRSLITPRRVMCTATKEWLELTLFQKGIMQQLSGHMSMKVRRNVIHMFKSSCAPWRLPRLFQDKDLLPSRCGIRAHPPGAQLCTFQNGVHLENVQARAGDSSGQSKSATYDQPDH